MGLDDRIFNYCERGQDPAFWAEPVNALSNAAFILAALLATAEFLRMRRDEEGGAFEALLIGLVYVVGVGSFLFHTFATRWASYADWVPIVVFMLTYLAYVLRRMLGLNWLIVAVGLALFYGSLYYASTLHCASELLPITARESGKCLNGTIAYVPAFLTLLALTVILAARADSSWRYFAGASLLFLLSMTFRTIDFEICETSRALLGRSLGVHFLWHILNAAMIYLLLLAAIRRRPQNLAFARD